MAYFNESNKKREEDIRLASILCSDIRDRDEERRLDQEFDCGQYRMQGIYRIIVKLNMCYFFYYKKLRGFVVGDQRRATTHR